MSSSLHRNEGQGFGFGGPVPQRQEKVARGPNLYL